jgi:hypothetical protein
MPSFILDHRLCPDQNRLRGVVSVALVLLASFTTTGCAETVVHTEFESAKWGLQRPERILIYDFAVTVAEVQENQGLFQKTINEVNEQSSYQHEQQIADEVKKVAAEEFVEQFQRLGLPAERAYRVTSMPPRSLGLTGQFLNVDEGNKLKRLVVGFGAGQSEVDIRIQAWGLGLEKSKPVGSSPVKLLEFETHADSGSMPGALATAGAGAAAQGGLTAGVAAANIGIGGVKAYRSAMEQMTARSVEQAVNYLSEFFGRHRWIPQDKVKYADRP